jgi:hypothetical protein
LITNKLHKIDTFKQSKFLFMKRDLFILLFLPSFIWAQEPQFKFYLAFEDASHAKDSVWFVADSSATGGWEAIDTTFGEEWIPCDSNDTTFRVYFSMFNDSIFKTFVAPFGGDLRDCAQNYCRESAD